MITAIIKSSLSAKKITCESKNIDLSIYNFVIDGSTYNILKNGEVIVRTDCLNNIEYPVSKQWSICRRDGGMGRDLVVDLDGEELLHIERDYKPESGSIFNNYLKIYIPSEKTSVITEFKQWKLFFPIKVKAQCEIRLNPDLLVISLLLAWYRYEYNSHDQMY